VACKTPRQKRPDRRRALRRKDRTWRGSRRLDSALLQATGEDGNGDLTSLAYWTGGNVSQATTPEKADKAVGALMAELRQQYFLAIESASGSAWHRLDVKTKCAGV
jgi:hypothetical protein